MKSNDVPGLASPESLQLACFASTSGSKQHRPLFPRPFLSSFSNLERNVTRQPPPCYVGGGRWPPEATLACYCNHILAS
eukprot:scaffold5207_cov96-Skeletonema_dohrnii-CCMP3373.AAC.13